MQAKAILLTYMRKNKKLIIPVMLFLVALPLLVAGQGVEIVNPLGDVGLADLVNKIIDYLQQVAFIIAPIMLIVAGFMYYFAGGKAENAKKATDIIKWTVVGLAIVMIANGIASLVAGIMGVEVDGVTTVIDSLWS